MTEDDDSDETEGLRKAVTEPRNQYVAQWENMSSPVAPPHFGLVLVMRGGGGGGSHGGRVLRRQLRPDAGGAERGTAQARVFRDEVEIEKQLDLNSI